MTHRVREYPLSEVSNFKCFQGTFAARYQHIIDSVHSSDTFDLTERQNLYVMYNAFSDQYGSDYVLNCLAFDYSRLNKDRHVGNS